MNRSPAFAPPEPKKNSLRFWQVKAEAEAEARRRQAARSTNDLRERWRADPTLYALERFGIIAWQKQRELLQAVTTHRLVACRAGQKVSKTLSECIIALWFAECFDDAMVIFTAPTYRQVDEIAWAEMRRLWRRAEQRGNPIPGVFKETPGGGIDLANGSRVFGFTTAATRPEKMSGYSGKNLFYIVDEATGVSQSLFDAIHGNSAGGARLLMCSNPLNVTGEFYDAFHKNSDVYRCIQIKSTESPNIVQGREIIPGMAGLEWLDQMRRLWGEGSAAWQARIMGEFPTGADDRIIGLQLVKDAIERWDEMAIKAKGPLELGVDVARLGGDRTVIFPKRGRVLFRPIVIQGHDNVQVAAKIVEVCKRELDAGGPKPTARIDDAGCGGGVVDILRHHHRGEVRTVPINASQMSDDSEAFHNMRAQLWFGARDFLEEGGALPPGVDGLESELLAPKYKHDPRARRQVESKDDIKKRLNGRSTDLADALCLAVCTHGGGLHHTAFAPAPRIDVETAPSDFQPPEADQIVRRELRRSATSNGSGVTRWPASWMGEGQNGGGNNDGF